MGLGICNAPPLWLGVAPNTVGSETTKKEKVAEISAGVGVFQEVHGCMGVVSMYEYTLS